MIQTHHFLISIRHAPEERHFNVSDIDVGPLVAALLEEPGRLGGTEGEGEIRLTAERKHEWEYLLEVVVTGAVAGGGAFGLGVMGALGANVGNWIARWCKSKDKSGPVEVRDEQGAALEVDPEEPSSSSDSLAQLLDEAGKRNGGIVVFLPEDV